MLKNKLLIFIAITFTIQGCATTSEKSLLKANRVHNFCYKGDFSQTLATVEERLSHCYAKDKTFTALTSGTYVVGSLNNKILKRKNPDGSVVYIHTTRPPMGSTYYGFRLKFMKTENLECPIKINTHVMNPAWNRHIRRIKLCLGGKDTRCHYL